jgi:hypothetical protein
LAPEEIGTLGLVLARVVLGGKALELLRVVARVPLLRVVTRVPLLRVAARVPFLVRVGSIAVSFTGVSRPLVLPGLRRLGRRDLLRRRARLVRGALIARRVDGLRRSDRLRAAGFPL